MWDATEIEIKECDQIVWNNPSQLKNEITNTKTILIIGDKKVFFNAVHCYKIRSLKGLKTIQHSS